MTERLPVYVIDDDEIQLALVVRAMLRFHDIAVTPVDNGRDGLALLHRLADEGKSAIIFLDLHMPEVNGYAILRQVAADSKFEGLYLVILSTSDEPSDIAFTRDLGFFDYIVKPTRHEALNAKIKEINNRHQEQ